jgi:hypothetical protein
MKSFLEDGGVCHRKWHQTRNARLLRLSGELPLDLCAEELRLTALCRYAESLLASKRVNEYLSRHHGTMKRKIERLAWKFESVCRISGEMNFNDASNCAPIQEWIAARPLRAQAVPKRLRT